MLTRKYFWKKKEPTQGYREFFDRKKRDEIGGKIVPIARKEQN